MTKFSFEGEINSLSIRQQEFLCDVLHNRGYTNSKVLIETVGKAGDNYIANVKRIIVKGDDGNTFNIIAKIAPSQEIVRAQLQAQVLFRNEGIMYSEVLPALVELQKDEGIPVKDQLRYAECYGVLLEEPDEIILLEDLVESDFNILDRFTSLSNECIKLNLKNLATLHSLSIVLRKQKPDLFEDIRQKLVDCYVNMTEVPEFKLYIEAIENDAIEVLTNEKYISAVRGSLTKSGELYKKLTKDEIRLKYSVVLQGDGWTNNIMFKLKDEIPVEAIMIDYQLSRVSNPVCDVLYMIFNCTDYETRRAHYHDWIDYYHLQLEKSLSNFGIKADFIFSRDQLDADLKRYSKLFFANAIMLSAVLIRKSEDAAKAKEAMENSDKVDIGTVLESFQMKNLDQDSVSKFKSRIEGVIDSFRDLGYIA
ncbi:uncharacterized protein LOC113512029 [Galleria mellonella]|uniref:Uncharacterized protein LOC113512029 n=1 Tax=Galleria mellonella TaxID=7137 RepID=A0A6J1WK16_GALME|nr:uncharacterized protein LOC113512029 [Galleria mellonella]